MSPAASTPCPPTKPRPSKVARWRALVLVLVHLLVAVHVAHWASTGRTLGLLEPSEAMEFSKHGIVNVGLIFFGLTILSTLVLGRFFCGWACHVVALQDLCRHLMLKVGITPRPLRSRALGLVPILAAGYMFLWPLAARLWLGEDLRPHHAEFSIQDIWRTMPGLWIGLLTLLICGFVVVFFLGSKGFCTYACPYGAFYGLADRFAPWRIRVNERCEGCGHCTKVCSSNVDVAKEVHEFGMVVDPGCMKCLDCISVCPMDALSLARGPLPKGARLPSKSRLGLGEELLLALVFAWSFYAVRGLFSLVPFLMALGVAGCAAFLALRGWQLVTKPALTLGPLRLKEQGRLRPAGKVFVLGLALVLVGLGWCTRATWRAGRSEAAFGELTAAREVWFTEDRPALDASLRDRASRALVRALAAIEANAGLDANRFIEWGWASLMLGDADSFRTGLEQAFELAPRQGWIQVELAHEAAAAGDAARALVHLGRAVESDPDLMDAWNELVQLEFARGRLDLADQALARGLEDRPAEGRLLDLRGTIKMASGEVAEAKRAFERATFVEPSLVTPWIKLAQILAQEGDRRGARDLVREGLLHNPLDEGLRQALAALAGD